MQQILQDLEGALGGAALPILALIGTFVLGLLALALAAYRKSAAAALAQVLQSELRQAREAMGSELAELRGRLAALADTASRREADLGLHLNQRLDHVGERLTASLADQGSRTADSLARLYERLALIDNAQASLSELSSQVVSLKDVLGNRQARGAFGQLRMEAIIEDGLPRGSYELQATLSNGRRPDCLVRLPSAPAPLVIDAKFPLESFEALRVARTAEEAQSASARIRTSVAGHIDDIAKKYLIPGETQDMALMFVPSEQILGELSERFPELIQRAHRSRVVIVSPNMLMLAVQTMQAIFRDVRMREQAGLIQREVGLLMGDVGRLAERARELERHFGLASKDVERIISSADRITGRGKRIEAVELEDGPERKRAVGE